MNHEQIEGFAALFGAVPRLTEIEVRHEGSTLRLRRNVASVPPPQALVVPPLVGAPAAAELASTTVSAEHVGVFHPLALQQGDTVKVGQVLGQIDTMRLLSDCKAPVSGKLIGIFAEEGQPVEYGQPLFEIAREEK